MADAINTDSAEIWKPVPGWEGLYEVSSHGRVKRLPRWSSTKNGTLAYRPERIMAATANKRTGYREVIFNAAPRTGRGLVHRLVCEAFNGPAPDGKNQVAHWDGIRTNNHYSNLRWASAWDNAQDRYRHGTDPVGSKAGNAKLTEADVLAIREAYSAKYGELKKLANRFGVTSTQILHIVRRRQWTHI